MSPLQPVITTREEDLILREIVALSD